jgi:2-hydroxycyclohexanecarboxyl-CoA dehydrogenase
LIGLNDKVTVVTGGGGGIGAATSKRFCKEGAKVAIWDNNLESAQKIENFIIESGGIAKVFACDITSFNNVEKTVIDTENMFGPIDILINNAGWDVFRPFLKTDPNLWEKIIDINLRGPINTHYAVLKGMAERGKGRIVNIASDAARVGSSGEAVYAACKAGIIGLSKTLAREHARQGITFNVVCPGPTETGLLESFLREADNPEKLSEAFRRAIPMGRLGQPSDLPGIIVFLASDDAAFITGQVISVSGGLTMNG